MKTHALLAGCLALLAAASVNGQTKNSGGLKCNKPEPSYNIEVGDRPGHLMVLEKAACTWTQGLALGSDKTKEGSNVANVDITPTRVAGSGTHVSTTDGGDKMFVSYRYSGPMKDRKVAEAKGTWSYTGGTGKLKGIKGGGTFTTTFADDGTSTTAVEGQYQLPEGGGAVKK